MDGEGRREISREYTRNVKLSSVAFAKHSNGVYGREIKQYDSAMIFPCSI